MGWAAGTKERASGVKAGATQLLGGHHSDLRYRALAVVLGLSNYGQMFRCRWAGLGLKPSVMRISIGRRSLTGSYRICKRTPRIVLLRTLCVPVWTPVSKRLGLGCKKSKYLEFMRNQHAFRFDTARVFRIKKQSDETRRDEISFTKLNSIEASHEPACIVML